MKMKSSAKRVLKILLIISKSKEGCTSNEISKFFPQALETIKNDLRKLKEFGFVIYDPKTRKNVLNRSLFTNEKRKD